MKLNFDFGPKILAGLAGVALCATTVCAQNDFFQVPKIVEFPVMGGSNFTTATIYTTNPTVVDLIGMQGIASLIVVATNAPATNGVPTSGTLTLTVYGANNPTNDSWAAITNAALAVKTSLNITNRYLGITNLYVTVPYLSSGYVSNAIPSSDGFAGQWVTAPAWTNTGVITTGTKGGVFVLGLKVASQPRYLQLVLSTIGSNTVSSAGGVLIGRTSWGNYP